MCLLVNILNEGIPVAVLPVVTDSVVPSTVTNNITLLYHYYLIFMLYNIIHYVNML